MTGHLDFDDIFGDAPEQEVEPAPTGREFRSLKNAFVHDLQRGVTTTWLAQAFDVKRSQIEKRLARCPVERTGQNNARIYDFATAVQYLVKPRVNLEEYLKSLSPKDLPEQLTNEYWGARLKEQRARQNAGDLWRTEDVIGAFAGVFKVIKDTAILWPDQIMETTSITEDQRDILDEAVADLLGKVGDMVLEYTEGSDPLLSQELEFDQDVE